jgi:hypothetical protein
MPITAIGGQGVRGAIRTALIGYGIAAYTYLVAGSGSSGKAEAFGGSGLATTFLLSGIGLQVLLILARFVLNRVLQDRATANQAMLILELIADGVTVFLFALATLGGIFHAADQL